MPTSDVIALGETGSGELRESNGPQSQGVTAVGVALCFADDALRPAYLKSRDRGQQ